MRSPMLRVHFAACLMLLAVACGSSDSDSPGTGGGGSSSGGTGGKSSGGSSGTATGGSGGAGQGGASGSGGASVGGAAGDAGSAGTGGASGSGGATGGSGGSQNGFRYMSWNIQHGDGTDDVYSPSWQADEILKHNPDVVCLSEADSGPQTDLPAALTAKSGKTWNKYVNGLSDMIVSPHPISDGASLKFASAYCGSYGAARAVVTIDGKAVTIGCAHLTVKWGSCTATDAQVATSRAAEVDELKAWIKALPEPRVIGGDMNAQHGTSEMGHFSSSTDGAYDNAWLLAVAAGTATAYPDNPANASTRTRRSDIDHIFFSKASGLAVTGAIVPDIRDMTKPVSQVKAFLDANQKCPDYAAKNYGYPEDCFVRSSDHQPKIADFDLP